MTALNVRNLHPLKAVVFPGFGAPQESRSYYDSAYETWKMVWKETLLELDGSDQLFSDHFSRQDYILGLFQGARCIALCCFRRAELSHLADREDSWFKPWPSEALEKLAKEYSQGVILSWLTIHPDYRRSVELNHLKDFNASDRLCELINLFLQDCPMDIAFGVTRNNRSVNKMSAYVGFSTYQSSVKHHGVDVDLITLSSANLQVASQKYPQAAFELWNQRKIFVSTPLELYSLNSSNQKRKTGS